MPRPNPNRPSVERLRELVAAGLNDRQVGERCDMTRAAIAALRKKAGIAANDPWTPERRAHQAAVCREKKGLPETGLWGEHAIRPIDERLWKAALAGRGYVDAPVPPTVVQRQDRPATSLYVEASS